MTRVILLFIGLIFLNGCAAINPIQKIEKGMMFHPSSLMQETPESIGMDYEDVYFKTEDGIVINGWLIKTSNFAPTVLFFHGNAGNNSHRLHRIAAFKEIGVNVFIVDYRGYGRSKGMPSEVGLYRDAEASYDYLIGRNDIDYDKIIVYGKSLGGAVAVDLATKRSIAALIVDSSFTSAKRMAKKIAPLVPSFLLNTEMDSIEKIKEVKAPKLIIHSPYDEVIPYYMGQQLFEAAPYPKEFLKTKGGHNNGYYYSKQEVDEGIKNFLIENNLQGVFDD